MQSNPQYLQLLEYFTEYGQQHVFKGLETLSQPAVDMFLTSLRQLDLGEVDDLIYGFQHRATGERGDIRPAETIRAPRSDKELADYRKACNRGEELLRAGKVAAFLVAGGQGTRLGLPGPKGTFPVYPITGKSLFEIFALKLHNLRGKYGKSIPLFIMTSPENDEETRAYFAAFNNFGLDPTTITFLVQRVLPCVDLWGKLVMEAPGKLLLTPNGHGGALDALNGAQVVRKLLDSGYEELFYFQVDNALVKICDPAFIGYHNSRRADVSTKVVQKVNADEKVGIVGYIDGKPGVIEYSELTPQQLAERRKDDRLRYHAGNTAIHIFSLPFLDNMFNASVQLPYHYACKKIRTLSGDDIEVVKFEKFIFDVMAHAGRVTVLEVERSEEFSPLKNAVGSDCPNSVRRSLASIWADWLEKAGVAVPRNADGSPIGSVEISPLFADSAEELQAKLPSGWKYYDGAEL